MKARSSTCELCGGIASLYCSSDSAFLCAGCDERVHGANFLAARHVRTPICRLDSDEEDGDDSASSSVRSAASSCISTAESARSAAACRSGRRGGGDDNNSRSDSNNRQLPRSRMRRSSLRNAPSRASETGVDARAEGVLAAWCAALGAGAGASGGSSANCAAVVAAHAMAVGLRRLGGAVPPRVCAAAAVWFAFKLSCCGQHGGHQLYGQYLRRLEECSGVPARTIAAVEFKLSRVVRRRQQLDATEGWAECESPEPCGL